MIKIKPKQRPSYPLKVGVKLLYTEIATPLVNLLQQRTGPRATFLRTKVWSAAKPEYCQSFASKNIVEAETDAGAEVRPSILPHD